MTTKKALAKSDLAVLAEKFGGCGCKTHCAREQHTPEEAERHKPRGRYTACEVQTEEMGLELKKGRTDE